MSTLYVYDPDTMRPIAAITGEQSAIECYAAYNYNLDEYQTTYTPAPGFIGGLVEGEYPRITLKETTNGN